MTDSASPGQAVTHFTPDPTALAHLELLLNGVYPVAGFMDAKQAASVAEAGRLPDGTPWATPVVLPVPAELGEPRRVVLTDPEGAPLAELEVTEVWRGDEGARIAGAPRALEPPAHGVLRSRRLAPEQVAARRAHPERPLLAVVAGEGLHSRALRRVQERAAALGGEDGPADVVVLVDTPFDDERTARLVLAARPHLPPGTQVVAVALPGRSPGLAAAVGRGYGAAEVMVDPQQPSPLSPEELRRRLARGEELPLDFTPPQVAAELAAQYPPRTRRGLTLFFTGLSGSGKSTVARGVGDALREAGRQVTLLDGDVVRRMLSKGLTFSREDRDANIRRIGYVAAEIARHGGLTVCAPIAPYAATRAEVRAMVEEHGDFFLVHVATPLEVCEARDRKGLYARARAGEIPEFTGVSDPYEEPRDAELVLDTSTMSVAEAVARVLDRLREGGWVTGERD